MVAEQKKIGLPVVGFGLQGGLATGMAYHFTFMWLFAINGFLYVVYTFLSGEWRSLLPNRHTPRQAWHAGGAGNVSDLSNKFVPHCLQNRKPWLYGAAQFGQYMKPP